MDRQCKTVSVVIAVGCQDGWLGDAVTSVLSQIDLDLQVIVVEEEGGAADRILDTVADERVIRVPPAQPGRAVARNCALSRVTGEYIAFLEPGDRYLPGGLRHGVDYLEAHPDVGMIYSTPIRIDTTGTSSDQGRLVREAGEFVGPVAFCAPLGNPLSTVLIRRTVLDAVGPFDEYLAFFEDTDLWRRIGRHCRVDAITQPIAEVRRDADEAFLDQDPIDVLGAYSYYVEKIAREDSDVDPLIRGASVRRLGEHTAALLKSKAPTAPYSDILNQQAELCFLPKVSIIIPVYNGANYLGEAIRSALDQTYGNFEVIVVNDGSTDGGATEQVASEFNERIRFVTKPNGGVATALNRGIEEMTGDYFSWLSHDDLYLPYKLDEQIKALAQMPDPRHCVLYSDFGVFTDKPDAAIPVVLQHVEPKNFRYFITAASAVHGCTLLVPRQAFNDCGRFNPTLRTTQDYDLWFRMASAYAFIHQPLILVRARSHPEQDTHALAHLANAECDALRKGFLDQLSELELCQEGKISLAEGYYRLASSFAACRFEDSHQTAIDRCRQSASRLTVDELLDLFERQVSTEATLAGAMAEVGRLSAEHRDLCLQRDAALAQVRQLQQELEVIHGSRSWKVTAPLRRVTEFLGRGSR